MQLHGIHTGVQSKEAEVAALQQTKNDLHGRLQQMQDECLERSRVATQVLGTSSILEQSLEAGSRDSLFVNFQVCIDLVLFLRFCVLGVLDKKLSSASKGDPWESRERRCASVCLKNREHARSTTRCQEDTNPRMHSESAGRGTKASAC